ncbi:hypothetical protein BG011_009009 [Mortierella polycephala]|uniref:Uncharacterized protein n=1 Tax=Mortierella polycephala TaxID=41804 RepID=A0A9P6PPH1_9FUNG|nr:hypothetical protein BG011_009009 [Mortierella polycephala]
MDTKKRPNDDSLEPHTLQLSGQLSGTEGAGMTDPTAMEVDVATVDPSAAKADLSSSSDVPPTMTTQITDQTSMLTEANKRVKLTMDSDRIGGVYSPSIELPDPSKEEKGLAEWVGQLDKDDGSKGLQTDKSDSKGVSIESKSLNQDLVRALLTTGTGANPSTMSDSILAVASLSEPLKTTLNTLGDDTQSKGVDAGSSGETPGLTVNPQLSSNPSAQMDVVHMDQNKKTDEHPVLATPKASDIPTNPEKQANKPIDSQQSNVQPTPEQELAPLKTPEQGMVPTANHQQPNQLATTISEQIATPEPLQAKPSAGQGRDGGDVTMISPKPDESAAFIKEISQITQLDSGAQSKETSSIDSTRPPQQAPDDTSKQGQEQRQEPTQLPLAAQPQQPQRGSFDQGSPRNTVPSIQSLLPLSSLPQTQAAPTSNPPQSTRPSRSTMSVSALLVNNEEDNEQEQEQDHAKRVSRNVFDQHDPFVQSNPPLRNASLPPPLPHQEPPATTSLSSKPLTQQPQRIVAGPGNSQRGRDTDEAPPLHQGQASYDRGAMDHTQPPGRSQEGASGHGARHRLASPVGIRSHQEQTNGVGMAGSNGKLPGLGSVTGIPAGPLHDPHMNHGPMYRTDGSHPPMGSRPDPYSPSQHSGLAHSSTANGHGQHYPAMSHMAHPQSATPNASLPSMSAPTENRHPRLIVKNDASLKMSDRPELFLGYYRYDPAQLLPVLQGKENSLLEVRVASPYLTFDNAKVKRRELWGTDVYTDDSDVVAMLIHSGTFIPPINSHSSEPDSIQPTSQQHNFVTDPIKHICPGYDLAVTLRVLPKLIKYQGSIRNRIKSRTWATGHDGVSLQIESVRKLCAGEALNRGRGQSKHRMKEYNQERLRVLSNVHDETTESLQNERAMRTATFEFTHQGDPCFKYSPELVMDRHDGLSRKWTSWRLKKEVLILENDEERYEISLQHHAGTDARRFDRYRFAVISPRTSLSSWSKASYPLDSSDLTEVLYEDLDWQDFEWVERGVVVQPSDRGKQAPAYLGSSALMEGVEPTSDISSDMSKPKSPPKTADRMDLEDVNFKDVAVADNDAIDDGNTSAVQGKGAAAFGASGGHDAQQDGVFCVVSRLFWRPMTDQRSSKPSKADAPTHPDNAPAIKNVQQESFIDPHLQPSPAKTEDVVPPADSSNAKVAQDQQEPKTGSTTGIDQLTKVDTTGSILATSKPVEVTPAPQTEGVPLTMLAPPTSQPQTVLTTPSTTSALTTNAMDVDTDMNMDVKLPLEPQPSLSTTQPGSASIKGDHAQPLSVIQAEREEGELEEGEIASD